MHDQERGKALVVALREAVRRHGTTWAALVPDSSQINSHAEAAEEQAYAEMTAAKSALRDHVRETYGISIDELNSLATP